MKISINAVLAHCTLCYFSIIFTINAGIGIYFVYYKHMNRNKETDPKEKFHFLRQQLLERILSNL